MISRTRAGSLALAMGAVVVIGLVWGRNTLWPERFPPPQLTLASNRLSANGYDATTLSIESRARTAPRISLGGTPHSAVLDGVSGEDGRWQAQFHAAVVPGRVRVRVEIPGAPAAFADFETTLAARDSLEDGTPDFLRLDDEHDRQAFRRWFTYLAEAQYFQPPTARPAEIQDCAALIRYAYREALHAHEGSWAADARVPVVPPYDAVAKYQYPYTPLGANLFRVRSGSFRPSDLADGAFGEFADAQTLWRLNCHFVSRGLAAARPGDLLFFRQAEGVERFHSMIYVGDSALKKDGKRYLVYHTGPRSEDSGEIRRLTVEELERFPQSEWRPLASNASFLGVYRWNILCSSGTN